MADHDLCLIDEHRAAQTARPGRAPFFPMPVLFDVDTIGASGSLHRAMGREERTDWSELPASGSRIRADLAQGSRPSRVTTPGFCTAGV